MLKILYKNALSSMRFLFCRCLSDFCFVSGKKSLWPTKEFLPHSTCLNVTLGDRRRTELMSSFEVNTLVNFTEKKFTKEHEKETITFLHNWTRFFGFYFLFISSKEIIYWPCDRTQLGKQPFKIMSLSCFLKKRVKIF